MKIIAVAVLLGGSSAVVAFWVGFTKGRKTERDFLNWRRKEVDRLHHGWPLCDACGEPITDEQENVGHECDLHSHCV